MDDQLQNSDLATFAPSRKESPAELVAKRWTFREYLIALFLLAIVATGYWTVWQMKFVYFDDPGYVNDNLDVLRGLPLFKNVADFKKSVYWAFTAFWQSNWHPLTWLSHMLDVQLYQQWPGGHHLTNVLFHSLNTLLLFSLFQRMTGKPWRSAAVAAMFAVHPMHVESVAWVAERKDVLSAFFGLLTMHAYVSYSRKSRFDGPSFVFSGCLSACIGILGWLWYQQCFTGLSLRNGYDTLPLVQEGLAAFAAFFMLAVGVVGGLAYSSGRIGLARYCGILLVFWLVALGMLGGLWSWRAFEDDAACRWSSWYAGVLMLAGVAGGVFAAIRRRYAIAIQCGIFVASLAVLLGLLNWIWYEDSFKTVVERIWCAEFAVAIFMVFGSLAVDAILSRRSNLGLYCVVFLLYALGLLAKPMLVTLPFVLLLIDFWPLGRVFESSDQEEDKPAVAAAKFVRRRAKRNQNLPSIPQFQTSPAMAPAMRGFFQVAIRTVLLSVEKLPLFALAAVSSMVTPIAQHHGGSMASTDELPIAFRLQNALQSYAGYLGRMFWPGKMMSLHLLLTDEKTGRPYVDPQMVALSAVVMVLLTALAIAGFIYGRRYLTFGWFWYVGTLVPVVGFVQVGEQSMADRYTYLPYIGLFVAVVWAVGDLLEKFAFLRRRLVPAVALAMVVILGSWISWTNYQIQTWSGVQTHLLHALDVEPNNWNMLNNYGVWLWKESQKQDASRIECLIAGNKAEADECEKKSLEFKEAAIASWTKGITARPSATDIHSNLGYMLSEKADQELRRGDRVASEKSLDQAEFHLREAVRLKPISSRPHNNLGRVLLKREKNDLAIAEFLKSIELDRSLLEAHLNLAQVYRMQQKLELAEGEYKAILGYYSESVVEPEAISNFCQAWIGMSDIANLRGKGSEAIACLRNAVAIQPMNANARPALAIMLIKEGQRRQAEEQLWVLLSRNPDRNGLAEGLGITFEKMGKPDDANFVWTFMAWAFATSPDASIRNGRAALILADRVYKRTNGQNPAAIDSLAAAQAECGQFNQAVQAAQVAIQLANSQGNKPLADAIVRRLQYYQQGKPYRCEVNGSDRP